MNVQTLCTTLALAAGMSALVLADEQVTETPAYNLTGENIELKIDATPLPSFPQNLVNEGFSTGRVMLALDIDADGELRDWLAIKATHEAFVRQIDRVIDRWDFSPPKWMGNPISVIARLTVNFESSGNVVNFDLTSGLRQRLFTPESFVSHNRYNEADFSKLDKIPEPLHTVMPIVPDKVLRKNEIAEGWFTFYIDANGNVRLPHLTNASEKLDAYALLAAQEALSQWKFTPPTVAGRPVLVRVSQPFVFTR